MIAGAMGLTCVGAAAQTAGEAGRPAVVSDPELARQAFVEALGAYDRGQYGQAYNVWLPLARGGDPAAQRNIGHLYRFGLGRPQDFEIAVSWYRRAADAGLARAQANLAMMYLRGQGVEHDPVTAAYWMAGAAVQGHAIAQYNLALLHLRGEGVPRNEVVAVGWLYRAAQSGHGGALEALGRVVPRLTGPLGPPLPPPDWPGPDRVAVEQDAVETPSPAAVAAAPAATEAAAAKPAETAPAPSAEIAAESPHTKSSTSHTANFDAEKAVVVGQKSALQTADSAPEEEPGLLGRLGRRLIEQTSSWFSTDQDTGFERRSTQ